VALALWRPVPAVIQEAEESATIGGDVTVHQNSIAVLPFRDHNIDSDHSYLADGVSDTVTHVLGQIERLDKLAGPTVGAGVYRNG
jgi:TolB-like protein